MKTILFVITPLLCVVVGCVIVAIYCGYMFWNWIWRKAKAFDEENYEQPEEPLMCDEN